MSLEENVNENVKPEISEEKKEENGNGENREEGAKPARRPQYRRPRRGQRAPKAVKVEEKEGTENAGAAEPKTEERRKPAQARGKQQGNRRSLPAVKEAGERKAPVRKPSRNNQKEAKSKLKIIPLGGLEQIGMNITAFEYEDSIIVVDCGNPALISQILSDVSLCCHDGRMHVSFLYIRHAKCCISAK